MVFNSIKTLIEKYENGETTLREEQQLKAYFSQAEIDPEMEVYRPMFQYFLKEKQEQFTKDVPLKPKKTINLYKWISVAAVAVLMFGAYYQFVVTPSQQAVDPVLAQQTREALNLLSSKLNLGTENINLLSSNFKKGAEQINYVDAFNETTNKIFKIK